MHESLRRYWPPEGQILLLKAALADLETARQAWRQWDARQELADATSPEVGLLAAIARRMPELAPGMPMDPRLRRRAPLYLDPDTDDARHHAADARRASRRKGCA